jgi:predicted DNA-binding transcriptional regulator AlpA
MPKKTLTIPQHEPAAATAAPSHVPAQLINLKEVCRRTGLGRTSIQNLMAAGKFPAALKHPDVRATRWSAAAVDACIQNWIAAATAPSRKEDRC